ncbi:MAG TPA: NAD(P)/FAD-dependent oxidoreductase [Clostridiaceae bacterium]|nr:NAD(P)/FAD-dependent oxidoreductase [Clostridiaceae bacterium]
MERRYCMADDIVIMGAGPAGLAAGYELAKNNCKPMLFESQDQVGGISKTIKYRDFYFDLGGHRFFTKFNEVNNLWHEVLGADFIKVPRLSRIYYKNRYFNYPLTPLNALTGMGIFDTVKITSSYLYSKIFPYSREDTFEQWVSNRFGRKLYSMFFKTYTEKVWGIPCSQIQAEWAAQRIKGLSLKTAVLNAISRKNNNIKTLINEFDYPTHGPGMMYNRMKDKIEDMGGKVYINSRVDKINTEGSKIKSLEYIDKDGRRNIVEGRYFISSIPLTELIEKLSPTPDTAILNAASNLKYRSLITVDIIVGKQHLFPDNWIYIHSPDVKLGRIQNFKNWSSKMVPDENRTSLGLEYFCNENDELWNLTDDKLFELAADEIDKIRICNKKDIEDYIVIRVPKAYPVYMNGYKKNIGIIESFIRQFKNLQPVGRYGLFKYNNMDHSVLTGLYAAKNILEGTIKYDTWSVNTDKEYHEEKAN